MIRSLLAAVCAVALVAAVPVRRTFHHWFPGVGHAGLAPDETLPEVADLPVVAVAAHGGGKPRAVAVLVTGTGGWADIDRKLAAALAQDGVATIGLDSLRYFLTPRTPERVGADVGRMIGAARRVWGARDVILVGYSFGADTVPVAYNRLPAADRAAVRTVALLGLSDTADLGIGIAKLVGRIEGLPTPTEPEVARIMARPDAPRLVCVFGVEEQADRRTICPSLDPARVELIETAGGHHFDGDYARLGHVIAATLRPAPG